MFWLGEYANILLMCAMGAILFLGGWMSPIDVYPFTLVPGAIWLILKILLLFILFALVKAIVPRYRYDQLMRLGWKVFLPLSLIWVVLTAIYLFYFKYTKYLHYFYLIIVLNIRYIHFFYLFNVLNMIFNYVK